MNVYLSHCYNEKEKIRKTYSSETSFDCQFKAESSIFDPEIVISTGSDLSGFNAMRIPSFNNRKYYITDISVVRAGIWKIKAHVDVLSTYANEILANTAVVKRQSNLYNTYLSDNEFKVQNNETIETLYFSSTGFTKALDYLLAVCG